jgi:hypothetical protein
MNAKPSDILEKSLACNRKHGWVPRMHGRDGSCCFMVAMSRATRSANGGPGFGHPAAFEAREALRKAVGFKQIAEWNDTRVSFREVEDGVMRAVRALRKSGR